MDGRNPYIKTTYTSGDPLTPREMITNVNTLWLECLLRYPRRHLDRTSRPCGPQQVRSPGLLPYSKDIAEKGAQKGRSHKDKRNYPYSEIVQHTAPPDESKAPAQRPRISYTVVPLPAKTYHRETSIHQTRPKINSQNLQNFAPQKPSVRQPHLPHNSPHFDHKKTTFCTPKTSCLQANHVLQAQPALPLSAG
jgi:hypothetical protein